MVEAATMGTEEGVRTEEGVEAVTFECLGAADETRETGSQKRVDLETEGRKTAEHEDTLEQDVMMVSCNTDKLI